MNKRGQMFLLVAVAMLSGLAGGVISDRLVSADSGGPIVVEAHEFRVLGAGGVTRAVLGGGDNAGLVLYDAEGERRAGLMLSPQGPALSLESPGGQGSISLGAYQDRGGSLRINQKEGGYAELGYQTITAPRGYPRKMDTFMVLYDKGGEVSWWRP